jgi:hypothetical protein
MASKSGWQGLLYYGTAGSTAATQVTNATDLDYTTEPEKAETTVRGAGSSVPIVTEDVVALKATITWTMILKTDDTTLVALLAAQRTGAAVALRTKSYSSGLGYDGDCTLSVKNGMPLKGQNTFEFTATPTDSSGRAPQLNV